MAREITFTAIRNAPVHSDVLKLIWDYPGIHRKRAADVLRLRPNRVCDHVRDLIREGWVVEGEGRRVGTGRAPIPLYVDARRKLAVAVSYDADGLRAALVNAHGHSVRRMEWRRASSDPGRLARQIGRCVSKLRRGCAADVTGIGLADPGMVDSAKGTVVRSSSRPLWRDVPLAAMVERKTGLPTLLEDSARARAVGEYLSRPEWRQRGESMLYVDYGRTIGMALVDREGLSIGAGLAGEIGHVVWEPAGPRCRCGARGCIERLAGAGELERRAGKAAAETIFRDCLAGGRLARRVVRETLAPLGAAVSVLVSALHPHHVVVGGDTPSAADAVSREIHRDVRERCLPEIASTVEFLTGGDYEAMALVGMGLLVFHEHLSGKAETRRSERRRAATG